MRISAFHPDVIVVQSNGAHKRMCMTRGVATVQDFRMAMASPEHRAAPLKPLKLKIFFRGHPIVDAECPASSLASGVVRNHTDLWETAPCVIHQAGFVRLVSAQPDAFLTELSLPPARMGPRFSDTARPASSAPNWAVSSHVPYCVCNFSWSSFVCI